MNFRTYHTAKFCLLLALLSCALVGTGCVLRKDRSALVKKIETSPVRLDPVHTKAPEIDLLVPKGYVVAGETQSHYDIFMMYNPEESDTAIQKGMITLTVTPKPITYIPDSLKADRFKTTVSGEDVIWREKTIVSQGVRLFERELTGDSWLAKYNSPDGAGKLYVQAFVVGSDSVLVEELVGCVESLHFTTSNGTTI